MKWATVCAFLSIDLSWQTGIVRVALRFISNVISCGSAMVWAFYHYSFSITRTFRVRRIKMNKVLSKKRNECTWRWLIKMITLQMAIVIVKTQKSKRVSKSNWYNTLNLQLNVNTSKRTIFEVQVLHSRFFPTSMQTFLSQLQHEFLQKPKCKYHKN